MADPNHNSIIKPTTSAPSSAPGPGPRTHSGDPTNDVWFEHSSGKRINTDAVIARSLAQQYRGLQLTIAPLDERLSLLGYARAGHASCKAIAEGPGEGGAFAPVAWTAYVPPRRRIDGDPGALAEELHFGKFEYRWRGHDFLLYVVDGRDGPERYAGATNHYVLSAERAPADALLLAAGAWAGQLHDEVWVFDQGYWQKSAELYRSVARAGWDGVILDPDMKRAIIDDHVSFYESRATYARLQVPWKRGIIYHGPPGNGKTISIKATMNMLYARKDPIPTLYVRSLASFGGPEYALMVIFQKARQWAPCYLVFEDLDSMVSDQVRSYFLNEVDGLKNNDGIFMIGSTNHLDRLDPGISKRPSRFDRKYFFPDPDVKQRIAYCKFWQKKLADNKDVEFPDRLCGAIADITDKFSFAYMQEAFVAALLAIARRTDGGERGSEETLTRDMGDGWLDVCGGGGGGGDDGDGDLDDLVLWVEIKKQVETLREGMGSEKKMAAPRCHRSRRDF
ncbi:putative ATPase [Rosellinia necatrix]|uniref:Putative ATPase n=1 Tax=Rosellinia necatrix TaxID=77044 RepID=A0A1W2TH86_ROSNE|nr:putative ATPase [Rosellinia necatrix]